MKMVQQIHIAAAIIFGDTASAAELFANISFFLFLLFVHLDAARCYPVEKSLLYGLNILNERKNSSNS